MLIDKDRLYINTFLALFWVRALIGFIADETGMQGLASVVMLLYDAGIIFLGVLSLKNRQDIIFLVSFLAVGYWITCVHNGYSLLFFANGLRDFIYIIFLIPIFRNLYSTPSRSELFQAKFDKVLYIFLWVQVFCVVWQFLKYGANDHGGGSLGNGYSGAISTLIYLTSFYLMKKRFAQSGQPFAWCNILNNKDLLFLLVPTFLNETKISFIFLSCYFILLVPIDRKAIIRFVCLIPILFVLLGGVFFVYSQATGNQSDITSLEYYTEEYLYADEESDIMKYAEALNETGENVFEDLPRMVKLVLLPELNEENPGHEITGYGIGQFKGGSLVDTSKFYKDNEWLLTGSIPYLFHLYVQMGYVGIMLLIWFLFNLGRFDVNGKKAEKGIIIFGAVAFTLILFYNDSLRYAFIGVIFLYGLTQSLRGELNYS